MAKMADSTGNGANLREADSYNSEARRDEHHMVGQHKIGEGTMHGKAEGDQRNNASLSEGKLGWSGAKEGRAVQAKTMNKLAEVGAKHKGRGGIKTREMQD